MRGRGGAGGAGGADDVDPRHRDVSAGAGGLTRAGPAARGPGPGARGLFRGASACRSAPRPGSSSAWMPPRFGRRAAARRLGLSEGLPRLPGSGLSVRLNVHPSVELRPKRPAAAAGRAAGIRVSRRWRPASSAPDSLEVTSQASGCNLACPGKPELGRDWATSAARTKVPQRPRRAESHEIGGQPPGKPEGRDRLRLGAAA